MPENEKEKGEREGAGSKWFATLQGLALKMTSQLRTMSITDTIRKTEKLIFLLQRSLKCSKWIYHNQMTNIKI